MANNEQSAPGTTRSPLLFEDFIEAATSAALRASANAAKRPDGVIDDKYLPYPIWVGIIIRDRNITQAIGNPAKE